MTARGRSRDKGESEGTAFRIFSRTPSPECIGRRRTIDLANDSSTCCIINSVTDGSTTPPSNSIVGTHQIDSTCNYYNQNHWLYFPAGMMPYCEGGYLSGEWREVVPSRGIDYFENEFISSTASLKGSQVGCPSAGSINHPHACAGFCKYYVKKARGCKDGSACARCHLCISKKRIVRGGGTRVHSSRR